MVMIGSQQAAAPVVQPEPNRNPQRNHQRGPLDAAVAPWWQTTFPILERPGPLARPLRSPAYLCHPTSLSSFVYPYVQLPATHLVTTLFIHTQAFSFFGWLVLAGQIAIRSALNLLLQPFSSLPPLSAKITNVTYNHPIMLVRRKRRETRMQNVSQKSRQSSSEQQKVLEQSAQTGRTSTKSASSASRDASAGSPKRPGCLQRCEADVGRVSRSSLRRHHESGPRAEPGQPKHPNPISIWPFVDGLPGGLTYKHIALDYMDHRSAIRIRQLQSSSYA
ncbi:hypothetical protein BIW11_03717 [Tropilaelaps mercedesae]|uniref:Uncharacterized protein n=1 Tax=Tropilaelaps mercedesae TaxID=418985 RepID=A0A1V9XGW3_9ACAR|nr:hypothetical protein BIW11_03717 [Tropilaelaps mercedesae]